MNQTIRTQCAYFSGECFFSPYNYETVHFNDTRGLYLLLAYLE